MTTFDVIRAKPSHCGAMIRRLRTDHPRPLPQRDMHAQLRQSFYASAFARAWLIDGRLAALGGVTGTFISPIGTVWLAVSDLATRHPLIMAREAMRQLSAVMRTRREIVAVTLWGDDRAHRFAEFLGFDLQRDLAGDHRLLWTWRIKDDEDYADADEDAMEAAV